MEEIRAIQLCSVRDVLFATDAKGDVFRYVDDINVDTRAHIQGWVRLSMYEIPAPE